MLEEKTTKIINNVVTGTTIDAVSEDISFTQSIARAREASLRGVERRSNPVLSTTALKHNDDLTKNLSAFERVEAALEFGERHFGVDHRIHPRRHLGEALADIADRAAERAEDAVLLQIELEQVELDRLAGGRAAGHEPPAALEAEQRAVERVRADMLEGDVDTLFAGELAHRGFEAIGAIIDDVIGAERLGLFTFGIVADGGEHGGADGFGHFDRAGADAGAAGLDQDRFAGLQLGIVEQHVLHGAEGDRRAGGVAETHIVRHFHHEPRRHVDEIAREAVDMEAHDAADVLTQIVAAFLAGFALAAGQRAIGDDAVADLGGGHVRPHGDDFARGFDADDQRQLALGESHAAPAPHIDVVEPDRLDADLHFAWAGRGRGVDVDDLNLAVAGEREGAHFAPSFSSPVYGGG